MNAFRWGVMAACLSLLTACGGGGGDDKKPPPTPQSQTPTEVQLSASYTAALSENVQDGGYQLDIVDPSHADLLRSIAIDGPDAWRTTLSRQQSSDGRTFTYQHEVALYYLQARKVYAVDLRRGGSDQSRQLSSVADACHIVWQLDSDLSGSASWLAIARAGADGDCGTSDDNLALIHSGTTATTAPDPMPFNLERVIAPGHDAQGVLNSLVTFEPSRGGFVHWRLDSTGAHDSPVINGSGFNANAEVYALGQVPGFQDRAIVQIDGSLRLLTWTSAGATLSPSLASGVVQYASAVTADSTRLYVATELPSRRLLAFDGSGTTPSSAPLDTTRGEAIELMVSDEAVWIVQKAAALAMAPSTLTAFNKATGTPREITHYAVPAGRPTELGIRLAGVDGTRVVYSIPSEDEDDAISLNVIDHAAATPRVLAARAFGMGYQVPRTTLIGQFSRTTHVFWCDMGTTSSPVDCSATRFKSYKLSTNTVISLGQGLVGSDATAVLDSAIIAGAHGLSTQIGTVRRTYTGSTLQSLATRLWQFDPDIAGSLTFIAGASFDTAGSSGSSNSGTITSPIVIPAPPP